MPRLLFGNRATTTLNGNINDSAVSLTLTSSALFPSAPFRITIGSEIIEVGAINKTTHVASSLLRGQESTTPAAHLNGAAVTNRLTAGAYDELALGGDLTTHAALTTAHGAVSAATASKMVVRDASGRAAFVAPAASGDAAILSTVTDHAAAITGIHGVSASTVESVSGSQGKVDNHGNLTTAHGAVSTATASKIVVRDASGRAAFAAPAAAGDAAILSTVTDHSGLTTASVHGSTTAATANKLVHRDASGRAAFAAPSAAGDAAILSTVTDHNAVTAAGIHGSDAAATASKLVHRDASGRAAFAAGSAAGDAVNKGQLDLKLNLAGGTMSGETIFADQLATRPQLKDYSETTVAANTGTDYAINLESGNVFELTVNGNVTFTFTNPPASGNAGSFMLILKRDATPGRTVTWPTVQWAGGTAPVLTSTANAIDILTFITRDAGTTWYGFVGGFAFAVPA